jgi:hypothetical protein
MSAAGGCISSRTIVRTTPSHAQKELVESVCRTAGFELVPIAGDDAKESAAVRRCLQQLADVIARLGEVRNLAPRHARVAVGAAVTFTGFVAETYVKRK